MGRCFASYPQQGSSLMDFLLFPSHTGLLVREIRCASYMQRSKSLLDQIHSEESCLYKGSPKMMETDARHAQVSHFLVHFRLYMYDDETLLPVDLYYFYRK